VLLVEVGAEDGVDAVEVVLPTLPQAVSNNSMDMNVATIGKQNFLVGTATTIFRYTPL
jgi:hypothetical protein